MQVNSSSSHDEGEEVLVTLSVVLVCCVVFVFLDDDLLSVDNDAGLVLVIILVGVVRFVVFVVLEDGLLSVELEEVEVVKHGHSYPSSQYCVSGLNNPAWQVYSVCDTVPFLYL